MPCIEISMKKTAKETKAELAKAVTDAFCGATGHPREILHVKFFEHENCDCFIGGAAVDDSSPYIHMLVYCPRIKRTAKVAFVESVSKAFTGILKSEDSPIVHICEHPYDNVGVGGKILTDRFEECAKRSFYYELPKD